MTFAVSFVLQSREPCSSAGQRVAATFAPIFPALWTLVPPASATPLRLAAMDVADMLELADSHEAHMFMQDEDSILYPFEDLHTISEPANVRNRRINVAELWSSADPSASSAASDRGGGVVLPECTPVTAGTSSLGLHSVFDVEDQIETAPTDQVTLDLGTVFPADRTQVLKWHPNRSLQALVELVHASVVSCSSRRRLRKKQFNGFLVLSSMKTKTYKTAKASAALRTAGRDLYRRVMSVVTGQSIRQTAKDTDVPWTQLSVAHKNAWGEMARVLSSPKCATLAVNLGITTATGPRRTHSSKQQAVRDALVDTQLTGYGFSLCFNTNFGQKNVETVKLVQSGLRNGELRTALTKLPEYKNFFDRFFGHFQKLGEDIGAPLVACGMEHSENGDHPARIHMHCFLGIDVRGGLHGRTQQEIMVTKSKFNFEGLRPNIRIATVSRKRNVIIHTAVVQAYYYVAGPKLGCLFNRGVAVLFQVDSQRLAVEFA